jgi:O-antigen ligase
MKICIVALNIFLILGGLVDHLTSYRVGPFSAMAAETILVGTTTFALLIWRNRLPKDSLSAVGLLLFVGLGTISAYLNASTSQIPIIGTLQNLLVYWSFVGLFFLSATESYHAQQEPWYMRYGITLMSTMVMAGYLFTLAIGGGKTGSSGFFGARSFALTALVTVPWFLGLWRYRPSPWAATGAVLTLFLVALSESRTATVAALLMFPLSRLSWRSLEGVMRLVLSVALIWLLAYSAFTFVEPIRARFTNAGDNGQIGGLKVNTSGREALWYEMGISISQSPWIGKGPGSSSIPSLKASHGGLAHPHNDYLRLIHDFGYVGLTLWLVGYGALLVQTARYWVWADRHDSHNAHVHLAAFMALIACAIAMITDNVVVYIFVMNPLGIVVGASIGMGSAHRRAARRQAIAAPLLALPWDVASESNR